MTPALDWVLDTNILIYLLKGDPVLMIYLQGSSPAISFASKIELLSIPTAQPHTESQTVGKPLPVFTIASANILPLI